MPGDSLDAVEFFMELEKEFNVELSDSDAEGIDLSITVGEIYRLMTHSEARPAPEEPTWRHLALFVAKFANLRPENVRWDTRPLF